MRLLIIISMAFVYNVSILLGIKFFINFGTREEVMIGGMIVILAIASIKPLSLLAENIADKLSEQLSN